MAELYPEIEPFDNGVLKVDHEQSIYWEVSGNASGKPALLLHGGPGSGSSPYGRRHFDPQKYRVIQFDQRNCGRSAPHASELSTDLASNTTPHLIADIESLRSTLSVDKWLVSGSSWGVTLALAYAEQYPDHVSELLLNSITLTRSSDIHWLYHEAGRYFPEQWERFRDGITDTEQHGDLVDAYHKLLNESSDQFVRAHAAELWCTWEDEVLSNEPGWSPNTRYEDPKFRVAFARIVTHYFHNAAWLEDNQILRDAHRLRGIPAVLIHGRFDLGSPPDSARQLHQALPGSTLHFTLNGHMGGADAAQYLLKATEDFAK
jgi:proline iminopeptidase